MKNLYNVVTKIQVGSTSRTHFNIKPTFHVSAENIETAAAMGYRKAVAWATKEYRWLIDANKQGAVKLPTPVNAVITAIALVDENWL